MAEIEEILGEITRQSIVGGASFKGLKIMNPETGIAVASKNFQSKKILWVCDLGMVTALIILISGFVWLESFSIITTIAGFTIVTLILLWERVLVKEWHATEHKLVYLIINNLPLTLEEIKKAPIENPFCGESNQDLRNPSEKKLKEALEVGEEYLRLHTISFPSSSFFSSSELNRFRIFSLLI